MSPIEHISDTARWVAIYRAMETERPDAIFRDPYARRLAGERGEEIVASMPQGRSTAWAMIVRTAVMDEIIRERIAAGADLVVNLAAGLDARPWRLDLPPSLRWVDVDFPAMIEYKTAQLRGETPRCRYEAIAADLTDVAKRDALFAQLGAEGRRALVISEGLLIYLEAEQVRALARSLHAVPTFRWWLADIANQRLLRMLQKQWATMLRQANAPMKFGVDDLEGFFEPLGWRVAQFRSTLLEAHRLRREMRFGWLVRFMIGISPRARKEEARRMSGCVLFERS
ncbi:MAG TPA: SAM-dependent methyltransferase [Gemmatimonadaceae bacterium]|nr:SAM-dependent methyltransferase [Gemmatimonadaceae bacterium]